MKDYKQMNLIFLPGTRRTIKFRGKDYETDDWHTGDLVQFGCDYECAIRINKRGSNHDQIFKVNPETVGQYVGIADKNGILIFEFDVVQDGYNGFYIVRYCPMRMCFVLEQDGRKWSLDSLEDPEDIERLNKIEKLEHSHTRNLEVIGNIIDNPELRKLCE